MHTGSSPAKESDDPIVVPSPHVADMFLLGGQMSFSAAQMDPDRVRMGERLKNIGILGAGGSCYLLGFFLTYTWFQKLWVMGTTGPVLLRASSRALSRDGLSGNLQRTEQPWYHGLFGARDPRDSPKTRNLDPSSMEDKHSKNSRLISLLSCGMIEWPRRLENGAQPTLPRTDSQASREIAGPTCVRLMA